MTYLVEIVPDTVQIYRIRYGTGMHRRYAHYFNLDTALSRVAWWMIFEKHPVYLSKHPRYQCACNDGYDVYEAEDGWGGCPLHNRVDGYYRRLHDRLVRWMKTQSNGIDND